MLALRQAPTGNRCGRDAAAGHSRPVVDILPFEPWHLRELALQPSQAALSPTLTILYGESLKAAGPCYTAFAGLEVIACAGIVQFWEGRAQVWSLLSEQLPQYKKSVHKAVKQFLSMYRCRRLECVIDPRSKAAQDWARHLGFVHESLMAAYTPAGDDQVMMVRR